MQQKTNRFLHADEHIKVSKEEMILTIKALVRAK
jgi:hypothetical protein